MTAQLLGRDVFWLERGLVRWLIHLHPNSGEYALAGDRVEVLLCEFL